jgi:hypothetical protein
LFGFAPGGFLAAFSLGFSLGAAFYLLSSNPLVIIFLSYGLLEIYGVVLAAMAGFLVTKRIAEALWGFFISRPSRSVDWIEVLKDYATLFVWSVVSLLAAAFLEALLGYTILYTIDLMLLIIVFNGAVSIVIFALSLGKPLTRVTTKKQQPETTTPLPKGVVQICPKCGAWISTTSLNYCVCGQRLENLKRENL